MTSHHKEASAKLANNSSDEQKKSHSDEDEESRCSNTSMVLGESVRKPGGQNESASSNAPLNSPAIELPDDLEIGHTQKARKGRHRRRESLEKQP